MLLYYQLDKMMNVLIIYVNLPSLLFLALLVFGLTVTRFNSTANYLNAITLFFARLVFLYHLTYILPIFNSVSTDMFFFLAVSDDLV